MRLVEADIVHGDTDMSKVEDDTLHHVLPDLVEHLDLKVIFDKLLGEHLIEAEVYEHLTALLSSGFTSDAVRESIMKIKHNPPGYLAKFIAILKSKDRTKPFGDMIDYNHVTWRDSVFLEELVLQSAVHCYRCRTWHRPRL